MLDKAIFEHELKPSPRGELEATDYINFLKDVAVETVQDFWRPVGYPWHYLEANVLFVNRIKESNLLKWQII